MKTIMKVLEPIITIVILALLSLLIFWAIYPVFPIAWVFAVVFYILLCFYYQAKSMVDRHSPSRVVISFCSSWYIRNMRRTFGYLVIFFGQVTTVAAICFLASFFVTMAISPFSFLIYYCKK